MRNFKKLLAMMTYLIIPFLLSAQTYNHEKSAKVWYFGDGAGLDFNSGSPTVLTNSAMSSFEGCAAISDENGQLLFYTNGGSLPYPGRVWNRNHQVMPNGNLQGAGGCNSSFQSSLILQHPKYKNLYYLFTTDCIENNSVGGLRYNIIDMNMDGGLGDVVLKGQLLTTPVNESLTAVQHSNGRDWWVIVHKMQTDSFYVYHFNDIGITGVIKQKIGPVTPLYAGALRASTNGELLVYSGLNWTALFDFDASTGIISNYRDLGIASYSNAFSPNCRYLYLANSVNRELYQLDLNESNPGATAQLVGQTSSIGFGHLQLAPDGKIYCARFVTSFYLGVINNPDMPGTACNYVDDGIYLGGAVSKAGLPNFPNNAIGECAPTQQENVSTYNGVNFYSRMVGPNSITLETHENDLPEPVYGNRILVKNLENGQTRDMIVHSSNIEISGLDPNTEYEVTVLPVYTENYKPLDHFTSQDLVMDVTEGAVIRTLNEMNFNLYPNPAGNSATLSFSLDQPVENLDVYITDAMGNIIRTVDVDNNTGYQSRLIDISDLSNGFYYVTVHAGQQNWVEKLIVVK